MLVSANSSSPELGLGLGRAGQGRVELGLGCAIFLAFKKLSKVFMIKYCKKWTIIILVGRRSSHVKSISFHHNSFVVYMYS